VKSSTKEAKRVALQELGEIRGGHVAAAEPAAPGVRDACRALRIADLGDNGAVDWTGLARVVPMVADDRFTVREGDVLVPLRSSRVSAFVARGVPSQTIAVGQWAIVTTTADVQPEYLAWYLTHPATARAIRALVVGSSLPFLPLSALRELEVVVPDLAVQRRIVRIQTLHQREQRLEQQLAQAREHYVNAVTLAALEGAPHPDR
jgi:hypothetical protein